MDKRIMGALIILASATAFYIIMPDNEVKMRIDNDKSTFYIYENRWLISGEEWNKLFNGSRLVRRHAKDVEVTESYDSLSATFTRTTPYYSGAMIIDTYKFDGSNTDVELFPVSHTVEILNASGLIYQYEVRRLVYDGATIKGVVSPQSFGRNMKVEFDDGYYYSKIYKYKWKDEGRLTVKYRISEDYVKLDMRLFDPPGDEPDITMISPTNSTYVTSTVWFNATLDEAGSWCGYSLDGNANASMTNDTRSAIGTGLPGKDASVFSAAPDFNIEPANDISIYNYTTQTARAYFSIDLDDIQPYILSITEANLTLYVRTASTTDLWILGYYVNDSSISDFGETTITWNNQPCGTDTESVNSSCNGSIDTKYITSADEDTFITFDFTAAAQWILANHASNILTVVLRTNTTSSDLMSVWSKDYSANTAKRPEFSIAYTYDNWYAQNTSMAEGYHTVSFSCNDTLGNMNTSGATVGFNLNFTNITTIYLNSSSADRYYEYGSYANLTGIITDANGDTVTETIYLDIDINGYGTNYTSDASGYLEYDFLTFSAVDEFDDSTGSKNFTANGSFYFTLNKYDVLDYGYINMTGYEILTIDGNEPVDYGVVGGGGATTFIDFNDNISAAGTLTQYELSCKDAGEFTLRIFRDNGTHYVLVGSDTETLTLGVKNYSASIDVLAGDMIGGYLPSGTGIHRGDIGILKYNTTANLNTSEQSLWSHSGAYNFSIKSYVSTNDFPDNLQIDIGDDGTDNVRLTGKLNDTTVWLDEIDDLTAKNLTYSQAGGQIVYMNIFRNSTVDYAKVNLTGYLVYAEQDIEDNYYTSGSGWQYPSMAVDEVWYNCSVYWMLCAWTSSVGNLSITSTAPSSVGVNLTWALTRDTGDSSLEVYLWNFTSSDWNLFDTAPESGYAEYTKSIDSDFINTDNEVREKWVWGTAGNCCPMLSETKLESQNYPNNISIDTGNDLHIDYSGTTNLSTETQIDLNTTAIQAWLDDECATVPCAVPVSIYTVTSGIIELTDVDVRASIDNPLELNITAIDNFLGKPFAFEESTDITLGMGDDTEYAGAGHLANFSYGGTNVITGDWFNGATYGGGYTWNGSGWDINTSLDSGLPNKFLIPTIFIYETDYWLMFGNSSGSLFSYKWSGSTWAHNTTFETGLPSPCTVSGTHSAPEAHWFDSVLVLYFKCTNAVKSYDWNGTSWIADSGWTSSAPWRSWTTTGFTTGTDVESQPEVFEHNSTTYLIISETAGARKFYEWDSSDWSEVTDIYSIATPAHYARKSHCMMHIGGTWYLLDGNYDKDSDAKYRPNGYELMWPEFKVNVSVEADAWGKVELDGLNISYYGTKEINVTAHNADNSYTDSQLLTVRYDNYSSDYPHDSEYLMFWLPYADAKEIEPAGQTWYENGTDIESSTSWDWDWNLSLSINSSLDSCLTLYVKDATDDTDTGTVVNTTKRTFWEIDKLNPFGINWYLNATSCDRDVLGIYEFYPVFESVCSECVPIW